TREVPLPAIADQAAENASTPVRVSFPSVTGQHIRVTVEDVREGLSYRFGARNSTTLEPAAIAELGIPGLRLPSAPRTIDSGCRADLITVDGKPLPVRIAGDAANASQLAGLAITPCDPADPTRTPELDLASGNHVVETAPGIASGLAIDRLVLASGAGNAPV